MPLIKFHQECNTTLVSRKQGQQVIYGLADERVTDVVAGIRKVAELHLAGVERIIRDNFESRDKLTPVKRDELLEMVRSGEAVVLDVRPPEEFEAGHVPGAINIPLDKLPKRNCLTVRKSWPIAAGPIAYLPMRLSRCFVTKVSRRGGWKRDSPSGKRKTCL